MACKKVDLKLKIPNGFYTVMELFVKALLKNRPKDIFEFGAQFFEHLLLIRTETGHDPCIHGETAETDACRFSNKVKSHTSQMHFMETNKAHEEKGGKDRTHGEHQKARFRYGRREPIHKTFDSFELDTCTA